MTDLHGLRVECPLTSAPIPPNLACYQTLGFTFPRFYLSLGIKEIAIKCLSPEGFSQPLCHTPLLEDDLHLLDFKDEEFIQTCWSPASKEEGGKDLAKAAQAASMQV